MEINLRDYEDGTVGIALDETTGPDDIDDLFAVFSDGGPRGGGVKLSAEKVSESASSAIPEDLRRTSPILQHPVFHRYRSETEMLRYLHRLESRDLSLNTSMIPLGSCTMKLNATTEMVPVTWRVFGGLHPFAPPDQTEGYRRIFSDLELFTNPRIGITSTSIAPISTFRRSRAG